MKALIFDMDDTLVATAPLWKSAETRLLESIGAQWSETLAQQYKGMNALDVAATIHRLLQPPIPLHECQQRMRTGLLENFHAAPPIPMPGAIACVRRMAPHAPLALASGSPLEAIEHTLQQLQLRELFSVILSSESVPRGKPYPDVFLAAAEKLGAAPKECLVFEDSIIGVQAALAAGMRCFAVPSCPPEASEKIAQLGAQIFPSLNDITWQQVTRASTEYSL